MQTYEEYLETMKAYKHHPDSRELWEEWQNHRSGFHRPSELNAFGNFSMKKLFVRSSVDGNLFVVTAMFYSDNPDVANAYLADAAHKGEGVIAEEGGIIFIASNEPHSVRFAELPDWAEIKLGNVVVPEVQGTYIYVC